MTAVVNDTGSVTDPPSTLVPVLGPLSHFYPDLLSFVTRSVFQRRGTDKHIQHHGHVSEQRHTYD